MTKTILRRGASRRSILQQFGAAAVGISLAPALEACSRGGAGQRARSNRHVVLTGDPATRGNPGLAEKLEERALDTCRVDRTCAEMDPVTNSTPTGS